jgi:hypothetical protein
MRNLSFVVVGLGGRHISGSGFCQSSRASSPHTAEAAFGAVDAPPFVRVGHNGHWVTTTWGC